MSESVQPSVALSVLLASPGLGLSQVAGPAEDRLIGTVGTTEIEDPTPYLVGGELLLTAGVRLPQDAEGIDTYVARVVAAGVAALGFGVAPVHQEVPPELVAACDHHGLPLLRLPPDTPFVAVGQATYAAIAEARNRDLREISKAQSALTSAAARPDALQAVLSQLSIHTGAWAVLFDAQGNELFSAGPRPSAPTARLLCDLAVRTTTRSTGDQVKDRPPPPAAAAHHIEGVHLTVHTLAGADSTAAPLALGQAAPSTPTAVHRQMTGMATVLLSLLTSPRHALSTEARGVGALVRLMLGASPAEVAAALALTDESPSDHWIVVHGRHTPTPARTVPAPRPGGDPAQLAALATALGTPYVHMDGPHLRALMPSTPGRSPSAPALAAVLGWVLGFSAPVPATDLPRADSQAERALQRAIAAEAPAVVHTDEALSVHALISPADARELARTRFDPLARAGAPGASALLETLRTWLTLHGSWDRTAAALQVHRNTVRHRLARVAELLDVDLQDPSVRMELWFALHWLPGEQAGEGRT
ncbi:DNA-binding transcriptional regulator, PucR family [Streptomyces sp. cf386]|uniref:PucR family transcriptional regulator n=1 Tax=Streptomyces sp. cf386 TaxID=1761904 RepID=UPI000881D3B4|nr:PucR family transcriptional regulator [Streptomyces sp. cf386]SDP72332.1 DNA-binding transcriptional regulator, PucR family [Streptomyces sp. cf386]